MIPFVHYWHLLKTYLRPHLTKVSLMAVLLFSGIALQLISPQIVRRFIDLAVEDAETQALLGAASIFLGAELVRQLLSIVTAYVAADVGWRATNTLREQVMAHCLKLDMPFHHTHTPGELIERIDGDVSVLNNFFSKFILLIVGNLLLMFGVLILLYWEDWRLGAMFTLHVLLALYTFRRVEGRASPYWQAGRESSAALYGFIEERLSGLDDLRANGAISYTLGRFFQAQRTFADKTRHARLASDSLGTVVELALAISSVLALALAVYLYQQGMTSIGVVYLVTHYLALLGRPLGELSYQVDDLQKVGASLSRLQVLLEQQPLVNTKASTSLPSGSLGVEFTQVSFSYERATEQTFEVFKTSKVSSERDVVLKAITFHLKPGRILGLLGRTGSGKTTISRLLFRLYDPQQGVIRLGGTALTDVDVTNLRHKVGLVTQDVQLFQGTLRENLTFFGDEIEDTALLDVIRELGLIGWYQRLPQGLDTLVQTGGAGFSAGEAQLIAFMRVFLKDPGLIILDEASSRLDPATEKLIEGALDRLLANRTSIIIAHRLTTVQRADEILILEAGRVAEYGQRQALMNQTESRFAHLLRSGLSDVLP